MDFLKRSSHSLIFDHVIATMKVSAQLESEQTVSNVNSVAVPLMVAKSVSVIEEVCE